MKYEHIIEVFVYIIRAVAILPDLTSPSYTSYLAGRSPQRPWDGDGGHHQEDTPKSTDLPTTRCE